MAMSKYLYGIIDSDKDIKFENRGVGDEKPPVRILPFKGLGMVISEVGSGRISPGRDNFLAHQLVLEEAMRKHTVLPLRFGIIAASQSEVTSILKHQHAVFKELLKQLKGKKELGVKALWDREVIFEEIVEENRDIKNLRGKLLHLPPDQTHYQLVEIGRMVEAALEAKREKEGQEILEYLKSYCLDYKINQPISERMILNGAFLVNDQLEKKFDLKMNELATQHEGRITFKYVGPVPPYNFVSLKIELPKEEMAY